MPTSKHRKSETTAETRKKGKKYKNKSLALGTPYTVKSSSLKEFAEGFVEKCAEHGVTDSAIIKELFTQNVTIES